MEKANKKDALPRRADNSAAIAQLTESVRMNEERIADPDYPAEQKANLARQNAEFNAQITQLISTPVQPNLQNPVPADATPTAMPSIPVAPGMSMSGVNAMFNSPENLKRIADLLSKADSGQPVEEVMQEILKASGMDREAFWCTIDAITQKAGENPFADKEDDSEESDSDEKDEPKDDKKEGEEKEEPKSAEPKSEPKPEKKDEPEAEEKDEEPKKSKSEIKREKKKEKDEAKLLKQMINLGEKLLKLEKGEDAANLEELKHALEVLKDFNKEEEAEEPGMPGEDMDGIEKTGPDIPPAMEGVALPIPEPEMDLPVLEDMKMDKANDMKVVDMAPPAMELMAKKKLPPGFKPFPKKDEKGDGKNPFAKKDGDDKKENPFKKAELAINDRVWRKADFDAGFETAGDEPGRIVEFGNGKAIVDWGHDDGIPTEEEPSGLILADTAAADGMFAVKESAWLAPVKAAGSPMGNIEIVDKVLQETSLHDILARHHAESKRDEDTVRHIASGKTCKVLQRLADSQLKVAVDGKELILWQYEVTE